MLALRQSLKLVSLALVIVIAACDTTQDPAAPDTAVDAPRAAQVLDPGKRMAPNRQVLARDVPGFGGVFFDDAGELTVYMTDPGRGDVAVAALTEFAQRHGQDPSGVRVRQGRFDYRQLDAWFQDAWPDLLTRDDAVFVDLDESRNGITIAVSSESARASARAAAVGLGIPDEAITVVLHEPIVRMHTLRDKADPIKGGYQIHFDGYLCTLGFVAIASGQPSFITNSHCTERQGGNQSTLYYQPLSSTNSTVIGIEVDDPVYFRKRECPNGYRCRYSDSARILQQGGTFALGKIAGTTGLGSWTVDGEHTIKTKARNCPVKGSTISKIGRTTGWTRGQVTATCINVAVAGSNFLQLDQVMVGAGVDGGDSGSPVFSGTGDVQLEGILWGGSASGFVYSPMQNIEGELGDLVVVGSTNPPGDPGDPPPAAFNASFTFSCDKSGNCDFDASGSTGEIDTYEWTGLGGTKFGKQVSHSFEEDGSYPVELTVSGNGESDMANKTVNCTTRGKNLQCR